ncbi:MAG TPA: glycosyltransferase family 4 protein [Thermodesulfobacteriota bacterium]|nr:glycosyltransferase family 4 protein [Thermodesulfobacteriota bacterium]
MKILLVNDYGTPDGGAEIQIYRLRRLLRERGHDARLFTTGITSPGMNNASDYKCTGTRSPFRVLLQTANPWAYLRLKDIIREFKPDLVHVKIFLTQMSPLILPPLKNVPSVYHVAWYRPICPTGLKMLPDGSACTFKAGPVCYAKGCVPARDWIPLMLQMKLFRSWHGVFDSIMANSDWVRKRLAEEGIEPVEVLRYGVESVGEEAPLSEEPTAVFAGRLVKEKGVDVLLRAFGKVSAKVPAARLVIAGDGPERKNLEALASRLNLTPSVRFAGYLQQEEMNDALKGAWVQVIPSLWDEPFGIVAIEAMARGAPVVASSSGGLGEIIEPGVDGFLVPPGDADVLSEKLTALLTDKNLAASMASSARKAASGRFSEEAFLRQLLGIYDSVLAAKSGGTGKRTQSELPA